MQVPRAEVVVIINVNSDEPQRAIRAIELIRATTSDITIFAVGEMRNPVTIVGAMRAGATEFIDCTAGSDGLLEAFTRYSGAPGKTRSAGKAYMPGGWPPPDDSSGGSAPPAVPIHSPRGGGPRRLPTRKAA
jgi:ActR/RegA family two-component response regulator